ncbi:hypothetical protein Dda_7602 [Drechslerella dactyloides]|uniref:Uncharacterized protein n=1 Tax=Drechslerella dactyloides TaxID=74499 RepID=A0AAD6NIG7_DREDA|nr:hypothetical protein Dda_7602 [Drechslerella dactyloides]
MSTRLINSRRCIYLFILLGILAVVLAHRYDDEGYQNDVGDDGGNGGAEDGGAWEEDVGAEVVAADGADDHGAGEAEELDEDLAVPCRQLGSVVAGMVDGCGVWTYAGMAGPGFAFILSACMAFGRTGAEAVEASSDVFSVFLTRRVAIVAMGCRRRVCGWLSEGRRTWFPSFPHCVGENEGAGK